MRISVVMCTYNGEKFLRQQLESIAYQTLPPDEIIVRDDGSTDGTLALLEDFKSSSNINIEIHSNSVRVGPRKNFEQGIEQANGDIIFLADQDDVWVPNKIAAFLQYFSSNEKAILVFSNANLIDNVDQIQPGNLWQKYGFDKQLRKQWLDNEVAFSNLVCNNNKITGTTVAFRSILKDKAIPFPEGVDLWHDAWLGLVAAGMNGLAFIDHCYTNYRIHATQQVGLGDGSFTDIKPNSTNRRFISLKQLYVEKRIKEIFPNHPFVLKNTATVEEEISFAEAKENYSKQFGKRASEILNAEQIKRYNKFSDRPFVRIIKDLLAIR